jgi:hypothetical protein
MSKQLAVTEAWVVLKDCAVGEMIKRTETANTVWVKGAYDRATKSYSMTDYNDCNREMFIKADKLVFVGFTF